MPPVNEPANADRTLLISDADLAALHRCVTRHADGRLAAAAEQLDTALSRAQVIPAAQMPQDVVTMGARAVFEDDRTHARRAVTLVFPEEADTSTGRVSVLSPLGAALLGLQAGQRSEWEIPNGGTARIRLIAVEEQPNASAASTMPP